jgi:hypothetical protein
MMGTEMVPGVIGSDPDVGSEMVPCRIRSDPDVGGTDGPWCDQIGS